MNLLLFIHVTYLFAAKKQLTKLLINLKLKIRLTYKIVIPTTKIINTPKFIYNHFYV